jgi:hypothetical protein
MQKKLVDFSLDVYIAEVDMSNRSSNSWCFTLSPRRPYEEYKRMVLEHTHGLFIT